MYFNSTCDIPDGGLWINKENDGLITLRRCCSLMPFKSLSYEEYQKIDDILDYSLNFNYSAPILTDGASDRCQSCFFPKNKIKRITVSLSSACNIHCHNCFFEGHHSDTDLEKQLYFSTLYKLKNKHLDSLQLTDHGEPFYYYNDTITFLKSLSQNDFKEIRFFTNMTLLSKKRILELKQISDATKIIYSFFPSIDGITKETFEATRCGANFEAVIQNLDFLLQTFTKVCVCCTIRRASIKDLPSIQSYFNKKGVEVNIYYDMLDDQCKQAFYEFIKNK